MGCIPSKKDMQQLDSCLWLFSLWEGFLLYKFIKLKGKRLQGYLAELLAGLRGNSGNFPFGFFIISIIFVVWWLHQE